MFSIEQIKLRTTDLRIARTIKILINTSMGTYKRNQVEDAICVTFGAKNARADEVKLRLKRLLVTDRRLIRSKHSKEKVDFRYAFYSQDAPGSGVEVMFSDYEAFALLAGLMLLEHGIPQATVVSILRQVRSDLETAHCETVKKDPTDLFDPKAVQAMARPGVIATDNTDPIFLALLKLPSSAVDDGKVRALLTVCRGHDELSAFVKKHSVPGIGVTVFEFVGLMHRLATNLSKTYPVKRGRSTI